MNYYLVADKQVIGPFDYCQIVDLFVSGAIYDKTKICTEEDAGAEGTWKPLDAMLPSVAFLRTRQDVIDGLNTLRNAVESAKPVPVQTPKTSEVVVRDLDIGFFTLIGLLIKVTVAGIPAYVILASLFAALAFFIRVIFHLW